jgi:hypothetical protein
MVAASIALKPFEATTLSTIKTAKRFLQFVFEIKVALAW